MDAWSIVSLVVSVAGIIYAVFTNRRGEKNQKALVAKHVRESEIDQHRYEEEKQRTIEANEAQGVSRILRVLS